MERLTNTKENRKGQEPFEYWLKDSHPLGQIKAIERLADYEDAEEQGLLLRLPCKVGDTAWYVHRNGIDEVVIDSFIVNVNIFANVSYYIGCDRFGKTLTPYKTLFFTREEAEAALAEKGGVE